MDKKTFAENLFKLDEMFLEVDRAASNLNRCVRCELGAPVSGLCGDFTEAREELARVLHNFRPPEELDEVLGQLSNALNADRTGELDEILSGFQRDMTSH